MLVISEMSVMLVISEISGICKISDISGISGISGISEASGTCETSVISACFFSVVMEQRQVFGGRRVLRPGKVGLADVCPLLKISNVSSLIRGAGVGRGRWIWKMEMGMVGGWAVAR